MGTWLSVKVENLKIILKPTRKKKTKTKTQNKQQQKQKAERKPLTEPVFRWIRWINTF